MHDALIIGGGPAGSTAGRLLARAGLSVVICERHRFPREKVCGECLSATGFDVLTRAGLREGFEALQPVRLSYTAVHPIDGPSKSIPLPRPMWGISRAVFDEWLLGEARRSGAAVLQPVRCEAVEPGAPPRARVRDLQTNRVEWLSARWVLLADGRSALWPKPLATNGDLGIKTHFVGVDGPRDAIELFGVRGSYGGLVAIEGGRWNAAFSVPAARVREAGGNLERLFAEITGENPVLSRRLAGARRACDFFASPLPRFAVREDWPAGVIPIGNAAAALEPIGGEGMGLALRSAELAAEFIVSGDPSTAKLKRQYDRLWPVRRTSCRAAAMVVSRPRLARELLPLVDYPPLAALGLRLMGKSSQVEFPAPAS